MADSGKWEKSGGIIAWLGRDVDDRQYVYAQKVSSDGAINWAANGINTGYSGYGIGSQSLVPDGSGGAIIAGNLGDEDVGSQWVGSDGTSMWTEDGGIICTGTEPKSVHMVSDGAGGGVTSWSDDEFYAERPMYFNYKGTWSGGHDVIGF